jgi:hypothetical protein
MTKERRNVKIAEFHDTIISSNKAFTDLTISSGVNGYSWLCLVFNVSTYLCSNIQILQMLKNTWQYNLRMKKNEMRALVANLILFKTFKSPVEDIFIMSIAKVTHHASMSLQVLSASSKAYGKKIK